RWQLSALLLSRARRQPLLHVREGVPARIERSRDGRITVIVGGATLAPLLVIDAEGRPPGSRRPAPRDGARTEARLGARQQFAARQFAERFEVHVRDGAQAYVVPLADDRAEIACVWDSARFGTSGSFDLGELLKGFPALASRIARARPLGPVCSAQPLHPTTGPVMRAGLLELDASRTLDPFTGESVSAALAQALLLEATLVPELLALRAGRQLRRSHMDAYARAVHRMERSRRGFARALAHLSRFPGARRRLFAALARDPLLFQKLLSVHQSALSPIELLVRSLVSVLLEMAKLGGTGTE